MANHFDFVPSIKYRRSGIGLPKDIKTTFNLGELVPLDCVEVLPGDTFKTKARFTIRTSSPLISPIMDQLFFEVRSFFVPLRLLYEKTDRVFGDPTPSAYTSPSFEKFPHVYSSTPNDVFKVYEKTIGDHLELPTNVNLLCDDYSIMKFRAYALIVEQMYRNENTVPEVYVQKGNAVASEVPNNNAFSANNYMGKMFKVSKYNDVYTSALPSPQKGTPVQIPVQGGVFIPLEVHPNGTMSALGTSSNPPRLSTANLTASINASTLKVAGMSGGNLQKLYAIQDSSSTTYQNVDLVNASNLGITSSAGTLDVSDLRFSTQLQRYLELDARYGSRINEYYLAHYGVKNPDMRIQFVEYLGGSRQQLNIQQVAQLGATTSTEALGEVGAYSLSNAGMRYFKGFTEHGFVMTLGCVRQRHTYQQGADRDWHRFTREQFYDPCFAHLSEQPIWRSELYADAGAPYDQNVFGYQEAWYEYRYRPSKVTGQFRSNATNSLDFWHLADDYLSAPALTAGFTTETEEYLDRVLRVDHTDQDQFLLEGFFDTFAIRVMPVYSVPGLVDHITTSL